LGVEHSVSPPRRYISLNYRIETIGQLEIPKTETALSRSRCERLMNPNAVMLVVSLHFVGYKGPFASVHQTGFTIRSCFGLPVVSTAVRFASTDVEEIAMVRENEVREAEVTIEPPAATPPQPK
jgi:hypothetical protein